MVKNCIINYEKVKLFNDNYGYVVSGCNSKEKEIIIDSTYNNLKVVGIKEQAFMENEVIESLIISDGIEFISDEAFYYCLNLKKVHLPSTLVKIGDLAFQGCSKLESIVFPVGLKEIGNQAFTYCDSLKSILIPSSVISIGLGAFTSNELEYISVEENNIRYSSFDNCNAIVDKNTSTLIIGCKNTIIPNYVKTIDRCAFNNCDIEEIIIPEGVSKIEANTFFSCSNLKNVYISKTVREIGKSTFRACYNLESISISPDNLYYYIAEDGKSIIDKNTNEIVFDYQRLYFIKNLSKLSKLEQKIIRQRFGLFNYNPKTLLELSEIFSLPREEIRQIIDNALIKMKA